MQILVTDATGYVGGRFVPRLLDAGHEVVCGVRNPRKLNARPWVNHPGVVESDANDRDQLSESMGDATKMIDEVAYDFFGGHFVHAMFIKRDVNRIFDHRTRYQIQS